MIKLQISSCSPLRRPWVCKLHEIGLCFYYASSAPPLLLRSRSSMVRCLFRFTSSNSVLPSCARGFSRSFTKYAKVPTVRENTMSPVLCTYRTSQFQQQPKAVALFPHLLPWDQVLISYWSSHYPAWREKSNRVVVTSKLCSLWRSALKLAWGITAYRSVRC